MDIASSELESLVRDTSRGEKRAEEKLFGILYTFVFATIRKRWRNSLSTDEISDIQLDCLEKLLATFRNPDKAEKVIEQGRVLGFVHVVAENTALDYNRKRNRRTKVFVSIDAMSGDDENTQWESKLDVMPHDEADISDFVLGGMETTRILSDLDGKYKEVIEQRISGQEYDEIAEKLGISVANARQIHKRGVGILRQKLISKHKSVLSSLSVSQSVTLKRLYTKDETGDQPGATEEESLEAFYSALQNKGIFTILILSISKFYA